MVLQVSAEGAFSCCASRAFASKLAQSSPYQDFDALVDAAKRIWWQQVGIVDWMSAFAAHPKIGDSKAVEEKPDKGFREFSRSEQAAAAVTLSADVARELKEFNQKYFDKFGFIFIIFAKGKSSPEILEQLKVRFHRTPYEELQSAAAAQMAITELRLGALLGVSAELESAQRSQTRADKQVLNQLAAAQSGAPLRSPITTHVLDQALGCPASGLPLKLLRLDTHSKLWESLSSGVTNEDGRVGNLLPPSGYVAPGRYRMFFDTATYLSACKLRHPAFFADVPFYPEVAVDFEITDEGATQHYHIPLLLSPYGYSTYKGS